VSHVVVDDHLLRDVLAAEQGRRLAQLVDTNDLATTNLYYLRLCKSVIAARGGELTAAWRADRRRELGRPFWTSPPQSMSYRRTSLVIEWLNSPKA
jgi:hypothetical protein